MLSYRKNSGMRNHRKPIFLDKTEFTDIYIYHIPPDELVSGVAMLRKLQSDFYLEVSQQHLISSVLKTKIQI